MSPAFGYSILLLSEALHRPDRVAEIGWWADGFDWGVLCGVVGSYRLEDSRLITGEGSARQVWRR